MADRGRFRTPHLLEGRSRRTFPCRVSLSDKMMMMMLRMATACALLLTAAHATAVGDAGKPPPPPPAIEFDMTLDDYAVLQMQPSVA